MALFNIPTEEKKSCAEFFICEGGDDAANAWRKSDENRSIKCFRKKNS